MGCIETQYMADSIDIQLRINFNMGCIETRRTEPEEADSDFRLTLTWDVLKLVIFNLVHVVFK